MPVFRGVRVRSSSTQFDRLRSSSNPITPPRRSKRCKPSDSSSFLLSPYYFLLSTFSALCRPSDSSLFFVFSNFRVFVISFHFHFPNRQIIKRITKTRKHEKTQPLMDAKQRTRTDRPVALNLFRIVKDQNRCRTEPKRLNESTGESTQDQERNRSPDLSATKLPWRLSAAAARLHHLHKT